MSTGKKDQPVKSLHAKLARLETELKEVTNRLAKALADYQNLEKRMQDEIRREVAKVKERLIKDWLEVYEGMEKMAEFRKGDKEVKAVLSKFQEVLKRWGVEEVGLSKGDKFDPNVAECIAVGEGEKDKVLEVIRKGYYLSGKLIRPVLVKVGKGQDTKLDDKEVKDGQDNRD